MQNQIYHNGSILQNTRNICNDKKKLPDQQLKIVLLSMATRIQKLQNQNKDFNQAQIQMQEKIRNKMIQIEERRKSWDDMMAEIFNEKERVTVALKIKMDRIDEFQKQTKAHLLKVSKHDEQINSLVQDQNSIKIIMKDKIQKLRQEFRFQLNKKLEEIKQSLEKEAEGKQFKFSISCNETARSMNKQKDVDSWKQERSSNLDNNQSQKTSQQKFCQNIGIIVSNMHALERLQTEVLQIVPTIERFSKKLMYTGEKLEVIEEKLADALSMKRQIEDKPQIMKKPGNQIKSSQIQKNQSKTKLLMTRARYFNRFLVENNVITYVDSQEQGSCILLGCEPLKRRPSFCIEIVSSVNNFISIGIVDENYRELKDCWQKQNFIFMRGHKGEVYCGPNNKIKQTGAQFKAGDQIRVEVNFAQITVMWYINNILRAVYKSKKLKEDNIVWVPIVRFYNNYDSVKWLA